MILINEFKVMNSIWLVRGHSHIDFSHTGRQHDVMGWGSRTLMCRNFLNMNIILEARLKSEACIISDGFKKRFVSRRNLEKNMYLLFF